MKIKVPTPEEHKVRQRRNRYNFGCGLLAGVAFFGLMSLKLAKYGFEQIEFYTWLALFLGIISFGYLAYKFGDSFWNFFKK